MTGKNDIVIRREGLAGRITLNRPDALNALTLEMLHTIEQTLLAWRDDTAVRLVLFDAAGERAFCAGGDIERLYATGKAGDFEFGRRFWEDEYRLNALIAEFKKPTVALMQGFVMGGGVGVACHCSHRIVAESTRIAMPECGIGLVPDVGGTYLLGHAPGRSGCYLGLTGARMEAADAIYAGFADTFIPEKHWRALADRLCETGDVSVIDGFSIESGVPPLRLRWTDIEGCFFAPSALECLERLEKGTSQWSQEAARQMRRGCPLSVACTHELVRLGAGAGTVRQALAFEYRFTWRSMSQGEFLEGVRAQIIDKDRNPSWRKSRLEDVTEEEIASMLAPLKAAAAAAALP
jgi:enoyl-CoA hydratase/carnithine racemase